ncbi:MAG: enolase C-terminal domain-like protein [Geminicoccaceae bacterium]
MVLQERPDGRPRRDAAQCRPRAHAARDPGDDYDIMLDCWQSMNLDYAVELCSRIEEYRPRWLEEAFMPDRIDSHVKLKAKTRIPLSGAEHEYTRGASSASSRRKRSIYCSRTSTGAAGSPRP